MSIVEWTSKKYPIEISSGTERDQELVVGILKLDSSETGDKWAGSVDDRWCQHSTSYPVYSVELRKLITQAHVLIRITSVGISISMNGTAIFSAAQVSEMNLAILEGQNVFDNLIK